MLSDLLSPNFSLDVRGGGEAYFRCRAVHINTYEREGGEDFIEATVQDGQKCQVKMVIGGDRAELLVEALCSCPYEAEGFCKHVWATVRMLESKYHIPAARSAVMETLEFADESEEFDAFESELPPVIPIHNEGGTTPQELVRLLQESVKAPSRNRGSSKRRESIPEWQDLLSNCGRSESQYFNRRSAENDSPPIIPWYIFEVRESQMYGNFSLSLAQQKTRADGTPGKFVRFSIGPTDIPRLTSDLDRHICLMLMGTAVPYDSYGYSRHSQQAAHARWELRGETLLNVLSLIGKTGRLMRRDLAEAEPTPIIWDQEPYRFVLCIVRDARIKGSQIRGELRCGEARIGVEEIEELYGQKLFSVEDRMGILNASESRDWLATLMHRGEVFVPDRDREAFLEKLSQTGQCPEIEFPPEWNIAIADTELPQPELQITTGGGRKEVRANLRFNYASRSVDESTPGTFIFDGKSQRAHHRRRDVEGEHRQRLSTLGFRRDCYSQLILHEKKLPGVLSKLVAENWSVLLDTKAFRTSTGVSVQVGTSIDWFELNGKVEFGGQSIGLPEILAAARRGEQFVRLGDGSFGMLPEEWLARHGPALELAQVEEGQIRYAKTQIGLIDALLAELPEARFDEQLAAARGKLKDFGGIGSVKIPEGFKGELRPYQSHGLAWMEFLREFGWGGCLADDMGLGKTVQMLAKLLHHKRGGGGPSLAVVPKSVVFNWAREAARFAPDLRVLDYTGTDRHAQKEELAQADLVLTTYGTLKRDIQTLRETEFGYVILDEAQAIKNPQSQNAKAVRLLKAKNRLALTGTPVENCIGDLWSIFEFLNPGMMGTVTSYKRAFRSGGNGDQFALLQKMLRPFILRRTKQQVAPELPARSEQLIECELSEKQAVTYGELRDHYRAALLGRLDREGMNKSKVYVLEALLRLRQAACHPGLIDDSRRYEEAAKLETLLPMLQEIISEGHKALVFSQFTSMLSIVRERLDAEEIVYEYLDGQTNDRQARVDRFQTDPACPLFLISLKAGGVGLNLTAAEYVFILDPWWNPAVEAQAIDRTHRIGQAKHVMAYRLIARNTVEAKILELQKHKRGLAEAIITEANSLLQNLTREDLEMLLS